MTTVDVLRAVFAGVVLFVACPLVYVFWPQIMRALGYEEERAEPDDCPDCFPADWVEEFEWRRSL